MIHKWRVSRQFASADAGIMAQDVVDMLGVSKGHAYKIIRQLNKELENNRYIVVSGKILKAY